LLAIFFDHEDGGDVFLRNVVFNGQHGMTIKEDNYLHLYTRIHCDVFRKACF
jgi:hypothetical protein